MDALTDIKATEAKVVRGPYQNGIRRRREIIESAARVFASYGYEGGSLRQIAEEVGVTPAALTRHFDSKEGLLAAVLENWDEEAEARIPSDVKGIEYFVRLREAVIHNQQNRGLIELFLTLSAESSNPSHPARQFIQDRYRQVVALGCSRLREAREAKQILWMDDATLANETRAMYAMMDGLQLQWLIDPQVELVEIFTAALEVLLDRWTGRTNVLAEFGVAV
jgi:AcrR family transcriptional regulator